MSDKPMLFSGAMVRAILAGAKTQTRRVITEKQLAKFNAINPAHQGMEELMIAWDGYARESDDLLSIDAQRLKQKLLAIPPYAVGDRLWVRETWALVQKQDGCLWEEGERDVPRQCEGCNGCCVEYRADTGNKYPGAWPDECGDDPSCGRWRSPIHMPKWAARLWLRVTDVRVQRVQEISTEDAMCEGIETVGCHVPIDVDKGQRYYCRNYLTGAWNLTPVPSFATLWDSINRGYGWDANPLVWVVEFEKEDRS